MEKDHRHQGLGTALLDRSMGSFASRGVETVVAYHWAIDAPATAFYRKHGFRTEPIYLLFSLSGIQRNAG